LKQVVDAVSSVLPHNVETTKMSNLDAEEQAYQDDVKQLKQWWTDSRWRFTRRPYTAEQIANKRGNLKIDYPSNAMSKKLWKLVEKRFAVGWPGLRS
jgi:isocitrate lyase